MFQGFSQRLLSLLQFTRLALVFTALSNIITGYLLDRQFGLPDYLPVASVIRWSEIALLALASMSLYGFGMTLNDIIDRRRDAATAANRPLPSGRIPLGAAHGICLSLGLLAIFWGVIYARLAPDGWRSFTILMSVGLLITFYDLAGKWLVAPGLLILGLIRMFHCLIPAPQMPNVWQPLIIFTHVTILSSVCYVWEQKRPALTRFHWAAIIFGVVFINISAITAVASRAGSAGLWLKPGLLALPVLALLFVVVAAYIRFNSKSLRDTGQKLALVGILWSILYDTSLVWTYTSWVNAAAILGLLPTSYACVLVQRWWGRVTWIAQAPEYMCARAEPRRPEREMP